MSQPLSVFLLMLVIVGIMLMLRLQGKKELANGIAGRFCSRHGLQLLDGTVAFRGLHRVRPGPALAYRFRFEYSINGADRFSGRVTLVGDAIENIYVAPEHLDRG